MVSRTVREVRKHERDHHVDRVLTGSGDDMLEDIYFVDDGWYPIVLAFQALLLVPFSS